MNQVVVARSTTKWPIFGKWNILVNPCSALLVCVSLLPAQTRVPARLTIAPGTEREIPLEVVRPKQGDMIDILIGNHEVRVAIVLPDGREASERSAKGAGVAWETFPAETPNAFKSIRGLFLKGPGLHSIVTFNEEPLGGRYLLRIDARGVRNSSVVTALHIRSAELHLALLKGSPGTKITRTVKVASGSTRTRLRLALTAGTKSAMIDIALSDPRVTASLRYPDGSQVTPENAAAKGVGWEVASWPPAGFDGNLGEMFGAALLASMMLPVEGVHHLIYFEHGLPKTGEYVVEVDARNSDRVSEATVLYTLDTFDEDVDKALAAGRNRMTGAPRPR